MDKVIQLVDLKIGKHDDKEKKKQQNETHDHSSSDGHKDKENDDDKYGDLVEEWGKKVEDTDSEEEGKEVRSFSDRQRGSNLKDKLNLLANITKIVLGYMGFVQALALAIQYNLENIPQFVDTKYYYAFMSLFLMLNGMDAVIDAISGTEYVSNNCIALSKIVNVTVAILYIPFIALGFSMAYTRMATSWDLRMEAYSNFEIGLDIVGYDQSEEDRASASQDDAQEFIDNITSDYLSFSILAVLAFLQDVYQAYRIFRPRRNTNCKLFLEYMIFSFFFGIITFAVTIYFGGVQSFTFQSVNSPDEITAMDANGQYSQLASLDFSLGVESFYAVLFGTANIIEGFSGMLFHIRKCRQRCRECQVISQIVSIFLLTIFQGVIMSMIVSNGKSSFNNPTVLFFASIIFDFTVCASLLALFAIQICTRRFKSCNKRIQKLLQSNS